MKDFDEVTLGQGDDCLAVTDHSEASNILIRVLVEDVPVPVDVQNCFGATPLLTQQDKSVGKGALQLPDPIPSQLVERKGRRRRCFKH